MDLDPFEPVGISAQTMRLLDIFLLHCLLTDSPPDTPGEIAALARNQHRTAESGRQPGLRLERGGREVLLTEWGDELLAQCVPLADALDAAHGGHLHAQALQDARARLAALDTAPSARVLAAMQQDFGGSHNRFVLAQSQHIRSELLARPYADETEARLHRQAVQSVLDQRRMEAADTLSFEDFRRQYLSEAQLGLGI